MPESKKPRKIEIGNELPFTKATEPQLLVEE
jgi:hypothetical protein